MREGRKEKTQYRNTDQTRSIIFTIFALAGTYMHRYSDATLILIYSQLVFASFNLQQK